MGFVLFSGCIGGETKYVCPDGSTVYSPDMCNNQKTTLEIPHTTSNLSKTHVSEYPECENLPANDLSTIWRCELKQVRIAQYCHNLPELEGETFTKQACLTTLAGLNSDKTICSTLLGNAKITCEAIATSDISLCDTIASNESKNNCKVFFVMEKGIKTKNTCENQTGEELAWCLIHNAETETECNQIDDTKYPDETTYCIANTRSNPNICNQIKDKTLQKMCQRQNQKLL
jgi:hypothetical protein